MQIHAILKILPKGSKRIIRIFWGFLQQISKDENSVVIIGDESNKKKVQEIKKRFEFYSRQKPNLNILWKKKISVFDIFSQKPILVFGSISKWTKLMISVRPGTFDVDFETNPMDGWAWTDYADFISKEKHHNGPARKRLISAIDNLNIEKRDRCYIFGTGPSLSMAIDRSWNDGIVIVCNTIVRDPELWHHLEPDFIVAGDAIYHFGFTLFAQTFRKDLKNRLIESKTRFVYPAQFHSIIAYEFIGLEDRLIPVPTGWKHQINTNLQKEFSLPNLGNVLGLLLLPLGCTISKNIYLWGFDGRAPDDKLFWSNSDKHSYPEFMQELQESHPKFFDHYVPVTDPNKYVRNVQGDQLDRCISHVEKNGWKFIMMHKSWTSTLNKRYIGE